MKYVSPIYEVTKSTRNKDIDYVGRMGKPHKGFKSSLPTPEIFTITVGNRDLHILDFAAHKKSFKQYAAEYYFWMMRKNYPRGMRFGYAMPKTGLAAQAVAALCEQFDHTCVFFAPTIKEPTNHQLAVLNHPLCDIRYVKIPAMKTLNIWIQQWAEEYGHIALPFGLSGMPEITHGIIQLCHRLEKQTRHFKSVWCAVSTGTMIRGLELGWPDKKMHGVAVARNIHEGEIGFADVVSYHRKFQDPSEVAPLFATTRTYDAKAFEYFMKNAKNDSLFINVGSDDMMSLFTEQAQRRCPHALWRVAFNSQREWGDQSAFNQW